MGTMKPISFDRAGQFGLKPKMPPVFVEQKEIKKEDVKKEISKVESQTELSSLTESFICPNCNKEFSDKRRLHGHMLQYTRNKKEN